MSARVRLRPVIALLVVALVASSCGEDEAPTPEAQELTRDAIGHYCNMIVADHVGPKGQIFVKGEEQPVWFSSVRDTIAFTMLPEEPKDIAAIYVNDMARASWDTPEPGTWIDARRAWYVLGSDRTGGMGAPEPVPFGERKAARAFARSHGGEVLAFEELPPDYFLDVASASAATTGHGTHAQHE